MTPQTFTPEADLHVHTLASGHGFSTINEIAQAAAVRKLRAIGMTDHGPALPGGPHPYHFASLRFIPETLNGVRIFKGIEANIVARGELDLAPRHLERLELVVAGFHEGCGYTAGSVKENTRVLCSIMDIPQVKIISHPGNPRFPVEHETIVRHAVETRTAIEVNNTSFGLSRGGDSSNIEKIVALCADHPALLAVGSDAHIAQQVGEFDHALALIAAIGIPTERIVNRTLESTLAFLDLKT